MWLLFGRAAMAIGGYEVSRLIANLFGRSHPAAPAGSADGVRVSWPVVGAFVAGAYLLWRHQTQGAKGGRRY
jgi:hypothetical protein